MTDDRTSNEIEAADATVAATRATPQTNWSDTVTFTPATYAEPRCLTELREVVRLAHAARRQVRARGSGHSWNDAIVTADCSVNTGKLTPANKHACVCNTLGTAGRNCMEVTDELVTGADGRKYRRIGVPAGMCQGDFANLAQRLGAPLPTQGPAPDITLSGFVANGCHGTGWSEPTIAELVYGLDLVAPDGRVLSFTADSIPPGFEDLGLGAAELMNVVRVNQGALGVLARIVFQLPAEPFNLRVTNHFVPVTDVFDRADPSKLKAWLEKYDYVEIFWFPYNDYKMHWLTPVPAGPEKDTLWVMCFDRTSDPVSADAGFVELWNDVFGVLALAGGAIGPLVDAHPKVVPAMSSFALKTMKWKNHFSDPVVLTPPDAFLYQKHYFRHFLDLEFTMPMQGDQGFADIVAAFYQLVDRMEAWRSGSEGNMPYPINLNAHARFVRNSQATLSPAYAPAGSSQHTCYFEYLSYSHGSLTKTYDAFNGEFYSEAHGLGWKKWGGLPNWGKDLGSVPGIDEYVHAILAAKPGAAPSRLEQFLAVRDRIDPDGATFTNAYLRGFFLGRATSHVLRGAPASSYPEMPAQPARRSFSLANVAHTSPNEPMRAQGMELYHDLAAGAAFLVNEHGEVNLLALEHDPATGALHYTVAAPSRHLGFEEILDRVALFHGRPAA
ncbi:D-arabinono-1,4-lactone oxidase [Nannocystis sp. SCPEA4]|uniref:D-arabinono-1,4-lactone oxidase n=1 Tax=Nannocystis sp. SCPEA4 TaxID=2996787 RepID=UPI00226FDB91|nr:D-arabinono-1,4-lactone oxidase [Nannocystis sp. SCPEA4]MCY1062710.1 FAD-binding protein [Nannocystis sp. SCPEA4]